MLQGMHMYQATNQKVFTPTTEVAVDRHGPLKTVGEHPLQYVGSHHRKYSRCHTDPSWRARQKMI
jgi:hypothetical protein